MIKMISQYVLLIFMTVSLTIGCAQNKTDKAKITPNNFSLTLVLMKDDLWFSFYDTSASSVNFMLPNELFSELNHAVEQKGKELNVIIRASDMVKKSTIDSIIHRIKSRSISKYFITTLSEKEVEKIVNAIANMTPPEPIVVVSSSSVITQKLPENNAIIIELKKDKSIWYTILAAGFDSLSHQVKKPITENLKSVITSFENKLPNEEKRYLIKGDPNASYSTFEQVIEALKQNNIYKYNLVTSE